MHPVPPALLFPRKSRVSFTCWPGGHARAVTFSFDDGRVEDRELVAWLDRHGLKATFNVNAGLCDQPKRVPADEIAALYANHEVATHTYSHPFPTSLPDELLLAEFLEDRRRLETLTGRIVRGHAYPFGDYDDRVVAALASAGLRYARTTLPTGDFKTPADWRRWHPTCHEKDAGPELLARFWSEPSWPQLRLLSLWGHSYEFAEAGRTERFQSLLAGLGAERGRAWFATNIEVHDYLEALHGLRFSSTGDQVHNPFARSLWIRIGDTPREIPGGASVAL